MLDETRTNAIEQAISVQEAQGRDWTNQSIYDAVGGNYGELSQYLKARRAQARRPGRGGGAATAVAEAEVEAQEPASLQEQLDATRLAYSHASGRLAQLRSQADALMLSEDEELEMVRLERRIERLQPVLERLAKEAARAQAQMDTAEVVAIFNGYVPEKRQLWDQIAVRLSETLVLLQQVRQVDGRQWAPLLSLRKPNGAPAFPNAGGADPVRAGLGRMPQGHGLIEFFLSPSSHPLTKGEFTAVLDADAGTREIAPRMIENHLKEW
jgi:hypothetical protein